MHMYTPINLLVSYCNHTMPSFAFYLRVEMQKRSIFREKRSIGGARNDIQNLTACYTNVKNLIMLEIDQFCLSIVLAVPWRDNALKQRDGQNRILARRMSPSKIGSCLISNFSFFQLGPAAAYMS